MLAHSRLSTLLLVLVGCGSPDTHASPDGMDAAAQLDSGGDASRDTGVGEASLLDAGIDDARDAAMLDAGTDAGLERVICDTGADATGSTCVGLGAACSDPCRCCIGGFGGCRGGVCNIGACTSDGQPCSSFSSCCSGRCEGGTCTPLQTSCRTLGNTCTVDTECCSLLCRGGLCSPPSFCGQPREVCGANADCCSGVCMRTAGSALGTC